MAPREKRERERNFRKGGYGMKTTSGWERTKKDRARGWRAMG
jgi:hypothetical protein